MSNELKIFSGIMDTDNPETVIAPPAHSFAKNGRFIGINGRLEFQGIVGNRVLSFVPPTGTNACIGAFYDTLNNQLIFFNYNSNGNHGIYILNLTTEAMQALLVSNTNTDGDILNFNLNNPIHSIDVLYGSDTDILYYVDSLKRLTEIDMNLFISNPYTNTKRSFIDVAKAPAIMPPKVSYENDNDVNTNNLRNSLFQFSYRPVYGAFEKPVYSSGSEVPLSYLPFDQDISKDVTKNSRICIYVQTGDVNVSAIEIIGRKAQDGSVSDWFKITTLNKVELGIGDNTIYRYVFYNDSSYTTIPTEGNDPLVQALQLQDYVPKEANTLALFNGNVLAAGGITEGYDKIEADLEIISVVSAVGRADSTSGVLFFAQQSGLFSIGTTGDNIRIYLSGVGDNDMTTNMPTTLANSENLKFVIRAQTDAEVNKDISYTETTSNADIADILAAISAAAVTIGYTQVSIAANELVLSFPDIILLSSQTYRTTDININDSMYANAEAAAYAYGVQYFDDKGRTNGVTYGATLTTFDTVSFGSQLQLKIYHRPPIWGVYFHVVRTPNTTYSKLLDWVSDAAFSNTSATDNTKYAYIGITSIAEYNEEISSTSGVVSYDFSKGDRITFISRVLQDGTIDSTGFANLDFEILGISNNPIVNGLEKTGTFLKILYPTNSINADFKLDGSEGFQNYQIKLYTVINRVDKDLEAFFEWGQQYGIGNAGTANAYHAGMVQSQSIDLSNPAIILLDKGDWSYRYRNVVAGVEYSAVGGGNRFSNIFRSARLTFTDEVVTSEYEIHNNTGVPAPGLAIGDYPTFADTDEMFYNKTVNPINLRIKAEITFSINNDTSVDVYLKNVDATTVYLTHIISDIFIPGDFGLTSRTVIINGIFIIKPNSKAWLLFGNSTEASYLVVSTFALTLNVLKYVNIPIVEKSFSDLYDLELSANSRASVIDENAAELYHPVRYRYSLAYQKDTNINQINRFLPNNYDELNAAKGDIRRIVVRGMEAIFYQKRGVGRIGIYTKYVTDNAGNQLLATTNNIVTKNNVQYYAGNFGLNDYPECLVVGKNSEKFIDVLRGYDVRRSQNGLEPLNEIYNGKYFIRSLFVPYNNPYLKGDGSRVKILGAYDYNEEEWLTVLQGGAYGEATIQNYCFSFNEIRKGYSSFFDLSPEWITSVQNKIISFNAGRVYLHDDTTHYANFFGVQYYPEVTLVFNDKEAVKKKYGSIGYQSNRIWVSDTNGDIKTSFINPQTNLQQISQLKEMDYVLEEDIRTAAFLMDANSGLVPAEALLEGDFLGGNWLSIKLIYQGSEFAYIYAPYINWQISNKVF